MQRGLAEPETINVNMIDEKDKNSMGASATSLGDCKTTVHSQFPSANNTSRQDFSHKKNQLQVISMSPTDTN